MQGTLKKESRTKSQEPRQKMQNPLYVRLQAGFSEWLRILNFEPTSQRDMPKMLTEFLDYLEAANCNHPHEIQESHLKSYLNYLYERPNKTAAGAISLNYIRKHLQVVKKFSRYLTESGQESFTVKLHIKGKSSNIKSILTREEISRLYGAAESLSADRRNDALGMRDKAMLALYYGCGLRKNEGANVNVRDILLEKELVYVRKGKGYKERYVPLAASNKADLENYIQYARPHLVNGKKPAGQTGGEDALLLGKEGKRFSGNGAYCRLQQLRAEARINKPVGLHTLRHSIASHLLHSGMKLEHIQRFLGHSSLESTQIYTHLKDGQV